LGKTPRYLNTTESRAIPPLTAFVYYWVWAADATTSSKERRFNNKKQLSTEKNSCVTPRKGYKQKQQKITSEALLCYHFT